VVFFASAKHTQKNYQRVVLQLDLRSVKVCVDFAQESSKIADVVNLFL